MTERYKEGKNSEYVYVTGKVSWVKAVMPNQWDKWEVTIHPNGESLEVIRDLQAQGVKNVMKKDDDGYFVKFSRPCSIEFQEGVVTPVTPPEVSHKDGRPMEDVRIGDGSDAIVKLEIYSHPTPSGKRAKAARFAAIRVEDLVPVEGAPKPEETTEPLF